MSVTHDPQTDLSTGEHTPLPSGLSAGSVRERVPHGEFSCTAPHSSSPTVTPVGRILIADDDPVSCMVLERTLSGWGYDVVVTRDGDQAWAALLADDAPRLAILDWVMPGLEGPEVCRRVRSLARSIPNYLILLTAKGRTDDVVAGLDSGADDYVTKPFDRQELRSRLLVGERVLTLQQRLIERVQELEAALGQVKELKGLLPICGYCKAIRDDQNYWHRVEAYITTHSAAHFSHGICPGCWKGVIEPELAAMESASAEAQR